MSANFLGQFEVALDGKNRFTVPADFRAQLRAAAPAGQELMWVSLSPEGCLRVYTVRDFDEIVARLRRTQAPFNRAAQESIRRFTSNAVQLLCDSAGRVVLPGRLRGFAGLGDAIVVVGVLAQFEVWSVEKWAIREAATLTPEALAENDDHLHAIWEATAPLAPVVPVAPAAAGTVAATGAPAGGATP
jgi:MraZ protein